MVNKNHPDYEAYKNKYMAALNEWKAELDAVPRIKCLDGEAEQAVHKKRDKKLKEIKEEYSYLFENQD